MSRRYEIREVLISDYGEGDFPKHRDVAFKVFDLKQPEGLQEINIATTRDGAEGHIKNRKKWNRRKYSE